jgi:putative nucleotidyltransferase with HDIG domain
VLHVVMGTFVVNRGAIFSREKKGDGLFAVAVRGFGEEDMSRLLPVVEKEASAGGDGPYYPEPAMGAGGAAEVLVPLRVREESLGAVVLGGKFTGEPYSRDDFELLRVVANQIAIALNNHMLFLDLSDQLEKNMRLYEEMRLIYHDTIQAFAAAIDAKDVYTRNHSQRVARYAVAIARELGWEDSAVEGIYVAGYLHDVGKLIISNDLLNKKEKLTEKELAELRSHPMLSYKILSNIRFPWKDVVDMIKHHHEKLDGTGYPSALKSDDISEGVKVLTLADSFDAMTSHRAYRNKLDLKEAIGELKRCKGSQFDPKIVTAFCRVLEKEIKGILPEPDILPHLEPDFDPSVITELLDAVIFELTDDSQA